MTGQPKVYSGNRGRFSNAVEVRERGSTRRRPLDLRLDLFNHSPTGFEWGYGGSGPAQLALAILGRTIPTAGLNDIADLLAHTRRRKRLTAADA